MKHSDFDIRMKSFEVIHKLTPKVPVIVRLDGRAFSTLTRTCNKPYDTNFMTCMRIAAIRLCEEVQGCKMAFVQSDEISLLLSDMDNDASQPWFNYELPKMLSISAATATECFTYEFDATGLFDSRANNYPVEEVANYFIWRQQDCMRNAIRMVASANFSPKQLNKVSNNQALEMLAAKGINFDECDEYFRMGTLVYKEEYQHNGATRSRWSCKPAPLFKENRSLIEDLITVKALTR